VQHEKQIRVCNSLPLRYVIKQLDTETNIRTRHFASHQT
jgi:hypothetical protein